MIEPGLAAPHRVLPAAEERQPVGDEVLEREECLRPCHRPVEAIDLNAAVSRAEPTLARLAGTDVDFSVSLGASGQVAVGKDDLEQMLAALVFSARESLTMGGSIMILTSLEDADAADPDGVPRVLLTTIASGYGVQQAQSSPAIDSAVDRCGGELILGGDIDRDAVLQVAFTQVSDTAAEGTTQPVKT